MRRKVVKFVFLAFTFLILTAFASVSAAKTIYVPDDYAKIQWAINHASAGDTIVVRNGIYYESITVYKQLTIKSENGSENCIVNGSGSDVFTLKADGIRIEGFTITGGMYVYICSNNNTIINNNIISNNWGIFLWNSNNNNISNNTISSNKFDGIYLDDSNNNSISNNIISNNWGGIVLVCSSNNSISNNNICSNNYGIDLDDSNNNGISENHISSNDNGIELSFSNNNSILDNIIDSNKYNGIFLWNSNNNSISKNNIILNYWYGIYLAYSNENIIYLNNFIDNTVNADYYDSTSIWNSTKEITYTYKGSTFTNYMGNYWIDYTGSDANGDGIGDIPYSIGSDKDNYPLMRPFEYYFAPEEPIVSVSTDKYEYRAGDVMLINVTFENPTDERKSVKFLWTLDIPDYNLSFKVINNKSLLLPPEFKKTFVISWRLPELSASFNASWYVALYDGIISEDTADWRYVCAKKKEEREIAREMTELREIERSVLQSAKLIKSEG